MADRATWTNGKHKVSGLWRYIWSSDVFVIDLDTKDRITGVGKRVVVRGERPEWGNWKMEAANG